MLRLQQLRRHRGAVALEGLICIMFMLGAFYVMWGVALMIFNQTKLNSAVQLSTQSSLIVYDRASYRGIAGAGAGGTDRARNLAANAAFTILSDNLRGMAPDQFATTTPTLTVDRGTFVNNSNYFDVRCSADLTTGDPRVSGSFTSANCASANPNGLDPGNARVTLAAVRASVTASYFLLSPLQENSSSGEAKSDGDRKTTIARAGCNAGQLCSSSASLSFAPETAVGP